MAVLNFKCKKCGRVFDSNVGDITYGMRLGFENMPECPKCGRLELEGLELTERGQTLVAKLYFEHSEKQERNEHFKESKIDLSISRERYFKDELSDYEACPKCRTRLKKEYASYLVYVKGEEDALMMGNDDGLFCPKCPVVVLDKDAIAEGIFVATRKRSIYFYVAGIIDTDAVPKNKQHVPLGEDDNPIPLVEFSNSRTDRTNSEKIENHDRKRKLGRNEPCHCGSGKKYKKCCLYKDLEKIGSPRRV